MRIAVVGAGVVGLTTAHALLNDGHHVTLVDRALKPGAGASRQNGAQLNYACDVSLASPAMLAQIPRLMLARSSPWHFRPGLRWGLWRWGLEFLAACNGVQVERSTRALLALARHSREQFAHWRAGIADESIAWQRSGKLVVHRDEASLRRARRQLEAQAAHGPTQQLIRTDTCIAIEPALAASRASIAGAVWTPGEETADCARVCALLSKQLAAHKRCTFEWGYEVKAGRSAGGSVQSLRLVDKLGEHNLSADAFVIAGGMSAMPLLRSLGVHLPVVAAKGYSIDLDADCIVRMPSVSLTEAATRIVFTPLTSHKRRHLRVAGFSDIVHDDASIVPSRIEQLVDATQRLFGLRRRPSNLMAWAGMRSITPTGVPCIGGVDRLDNLFVNLGQGALGFTLAFGSASVLADEVAGRRGVWSRPSVLTGEPHPCV